MKKKGLAVLVILLFIGICAIPSTGSVIKETYTQVSSGDTLYVGGSGPGNYSSIQSAVDDDVDGDTVFIYSGVYHEHDIRVEKSISIVGEDSETTIIDGDDISQYHILILFDDNSFVKSLTFRNIRSSGLMVWCCDGNQILDCRGIDILEEGVCIVDSDNNYVSNYVMLDNGIGIYITGNLGPGISSGNVIENCSFPDTGFIWLYEATDNVINNCFFDGGGIRVQSPGCVNNTYMNCQFYNTTGIEFNQEGGNEKIINCYFNDASTYGIDIESSHPGLEIRDCTFIGSWASSIIFWSPAVDVVVSGCKFVNNGYEGLVFFSTLRYVDVSYCHFENNKFGINMYVSNFWNSFHHNNFIDNEANIHTRGTGSAVRFMINSWEQNYWDDYNGILPWYHIFGFLNWDFNPASEPNDIEV